MIEVVESSLHNLARERRQVWRGGLGDQCDVGVVAGGAQRDLQADAAAGAREMNSVVSRRLMRRRRCR
jgi:hypothetical protein